MNLPMKVELSFSRKEHQGAETFSVNATSLQKSWYHGKGTARDVSVILRYGTGSPKLS